MTPLSSADVRDPAGRLLAGAHVLDSCSQGWRVGLELPDGSTTHPTTEVTVTHRAEAALRAASAHAKGEELINAPLAGSLVAKGLAEVVRVVRGGGRVVKLTPAGKASALALAANPLAAPKTQVES